MPLRRARGRSCHACSVARATPAYGDRVTPFPICFARWFLPLAVPLGMGPRRSRVEIGDQGVHVRMGLAFRATFPVTSVRAAALAPRLPFLGWGVHGWRGRWLVNGSARGLVRIELEPAARARVLGVPVRLRQLWVSVDDPAGLVAALVPAP